MSISIDFTPEVEAALARRAAAAGKDVPTFIKEYVTERLAADVSKPDKKRLTPEEFEARLDAIANRHPGVSTFVDDSRESAYAGRE